MEKKKDENIKPSYFLFPLIQSMLGAYGALMISSLLKDHSWLNDWLDETFVSEILNWAIRIVIICTIVYGEINITRCLIINLKYLGAAITSVTVYICNFIITSIMSYLITPMYKVINFVLFF